MNNDIHITITEDNNQITYTWKAFVVDYNKNFKYIDVGLFDNYENLYYFRTFADFWLFHLFAKKVTNLIELYMETHP